jgi:hypothetical protein
MERRMEEGVGVAAPTPKVDPFCGSGSIAKVSVSDSNTVQTLINIYQFISDVESELTSVSVWLDIQAANVAADTTMDEGDREALTQAFELAIDGVNELLSDCDPAAGGVQVALERLV